MFHRANLYKLPLNSEIAHGGLGQILTSRIATDADLNGACNFIDFTEMPPGASIGQHTHSPEEEEYYLILSGSGQMTSNGKQFEVSTGDLVRNPPGGTHGLKNTGDQTLKLFVFEVVVQK